MPVSYLNNTKLQVFSFIVLDRLLLRLFLITSFLLGSYSAVFAQQPSLEIEIRGVQADPGEIMVALFSGSAGFPSDDKKAVRAGIARRSGSSATIRFDDLPAGQYAVSVFHDANSNKLLDTGFFGIPKEGYGISNNAFNRLGPPEYQECSFRLTRSQQIALDLKY